MRPTLIGSLLDAARHNVARNGPDVAIFESGTVYRALSEDRGGDGGPAGYAADEHHALGALLSGALEPRSWRGERREADFFAAKALLGAVLDRFHVEWSVAPAVWPFLHPGRSAAVLAHAPGREPLRLGFLGELHPLVAETWDIAARGRVRDRPRQARRARPAGRRVHRVRAVPGAAPGPGGDAAGAVSAAETLERVRAAAARRSTTCACSTCTRAQQVGEGRRSLALALSFRALERTLTDEDIAPVRARIVAALQEVGGELRG